MHKQPGSLGITTAIVGAIMLLSGSVAMADVLIVPNTFVPNTAATADSVNQNFNAVETEVTDNANDISTNAAGISTNATDIGTNATGISTNASDIADNFSAINANTVDITDNFNALDQRLIPLEAGLNGQDVPVDCASGDTTTLLNTTLIPGNTYVIDGFCDGPIYIFEPAGRYRFRGANADKTVDGIVSPLGQTEGYVVGAYGSVSILFEDLTVSGANYTSQGDGIYVSTFRLDGIASLELSNVNVVGGDAGILITNNSNAYINAGVEVTGFRQSGLAAGRGGSISVSDPVTVTGANGIPGDYSEAVSAFQGGSIVISDGGTFSGGTDDGNNSLFESVSVGAYGNAMVRIRNSGTVTLTGGIESFRSSSVRIRTGTLTAPTDLQLGGIEIGQASVIRLENMTINGEIAMYTSNSHIRLQNSDHSGGDIFVGDTNSLTVDGGSLSNLSDNGIFIGAQAHMNLSGVTIGNGIVSIDIGNFGILSHSGTNFGGRAINCSTVGSFILGDATSIGVQTGC